MKFIATIEDDEKPNIQKIAASLQDMGVVVEQVMKITGIITGDTAERPLQELKIKGIKSVEPDQKKKKLH